MLYILFNTSEEEMNFKNLIKKKYEKDNLNREQISTYENPTSYNLNDKNILAKLIGEIRCVS